MNSTDSTTDLFLLVARPRKRGRNPKELHRDTFDRLATDGAIGAPGGALAFGYVRVSSDEQADKGGGIQRQIEHCHEAAQRAGLRIPWEMLYSDDESGFTLAREGLRALCDSLLRPGRAAQALVFENLDRLSRHDDWHQGYLLEHLIRAGVHVASYTPLGGSMERKVQGMVAGESHRKDRERMRGGLDEKARNGFVTARKPLYGYRFTYPVNAQGVQNQRETQLAIVEEDAAVVRQAFELVLQGNTLNGVAERLPQRPGRVRWRAAYIQRMITNPAYKGEWTHNRTKVVAPRSSLQVARPPEDWIIVPVPAIVDAATWAAAQEALEANRRMSRRNARREYLFTGLLKCAQCGKNLHGSGGKECELYRCSGRTNHTTECSSPYVSVRRLDSVLWAAVMGLFSRDDLDSLLIDDGQVERAQIAHLAKELQKLERAIAGLDTAYLTGPDAFEPGEYTTKRRGLLAQKKRLQAERATLQAKVVSEDELEHQRARLRLIGWLARLGGPTPDQPFEEKRRIIKALVRTVTVDTATESFVLEGKFGRIEDVIPRAGEDLLKARLDAAGLEPHARQAALEHCEKEFQQMRAAAANLEKHTSARLTKTERPSIETHSLSK